MLHLLQLIPNKSQKEKQAYRFFLGAGSFSDPKSQEQVIVKRFAVRGGLNLEVNKLLLLIGKKKYIYIYI